MAPRVGFEPTTSRLTAECSTVELSRSIKKLYNYVMSISLDLNGSPSWIRTNNISVNSRVLYR
jgi:hypothetical protein